MADTWCSTAYSGSRMLVYYFYPSKLNIEHDIRFPVVFLGAGVIYVVFSHPCFFFGLNGTPFWDGFVPYGLWFARVVCQVP